MISTQEDLFASPPIAPLDGVTEADQANLRAFLLLRGWTNREEVARGLAWPVRKVRAVAQSLGAAIIRCQAGYKLRVNCTREDLPLMQQAADAAGSQARIQRAYELAVLRAIHALIG
jgi:hypothetical protein